MNVMMWDNRVRLPDGVTPLAWIPQRSELVTAPYVASTALTQATSGAAEIRSTGSTVARHQILLPKKD